MHIANHLLFRKAVIIKVKFSGYEFDEVNFDGMKLKPAYFPALGQVSGKPYRKSFTNISCHYQRREWTGAEFPSSTSKASKSVA